MTIGPHPAHPSTPESRARDLERCENGVILSQKQVVEGLSRLSKILCVGYADSDMNAAIIELRAAANHLERLRGEWPL